MPSFAGSSHIWCQKGKEGKGAASIFPPSGAHQVYCYIKAAEICLFSLNILGHPPQHCSHLFFSLQDIQGSSPTQAGVRCAQWVDILLTRRQRKSTKIVQNVKIMCEDKTKAHKHALWVNVLLFKKNWKLNKWIMEKPCADIEGLPLFLSARTHSHGELF